MSAKLSIQNLISHRFRGFSERENTLAGLKAALDFGVQNLEFDVRVSACGTPMIYHDEHAPDEQNKQKIVSDYPRAAFADLGGAFAHMPTLDTLLELCASHPNQTAQLLIDIKDLGFEHEIHALVMAHRLSHRVVYVSWVAEVLYRIHRLAPTIPLCLSHWCAPIDQKIADKHGIYQSNDGIIPKIDTAYIIGKRTGWAVAVPLQGEFLEMLKRTNGGICVPQNMVSQSLCQYYHDHDLFISTFSYTDWPTINAHRSLMNIDLFFIDNKTVFRELSAVP